MYSLDEHHFFVGNALHNWYKTWSAIINILLLSNNIIGTVDKEYLI